MNRLERALTRLAGDLQGFGLRWALVGGMAVSIRAEPRTTQDVDVAVAVGSDPEAERTEILNLIQERGFHRGKDLQEEFARLLAAE